MLTADFLVDYVRVDRSIGSSWLVRRIIAILGVFFSFICGLKRAAS